MSKYVSKISQKYPSRWIAFVRELGTLSESDSDFDNEFELSDLKGLGTISMTPRILFRSGVAAFGMEKHRSIRRMLSTPPATSLASRSEASSSNLEKNTSLIESIDCGPFTALRLVSLLLFLQNVASLLPHSSLIRCRVFLNDVHQVFSSSHDR